MRVRGVFKIFYSSFDKEKKSILEQISGGLNLGNAWVGCLWLCCDTDSLLEYARQGVGSISRIQRLEMQKVFREGL